MSESELSEFELVELNLQNRLIYSDHSSNSINLVQTKKAPAISRRRPGFKIKNKKFLSVSRVIPTQFIFQFTKFGVLVY